MTTKQIKAIAHILYKAYEGGVNISVFPLVAKAIITDVADALGHDVFMQSKDYDHDRFMQAVTEGKGL